MPSIRPEEANKRALAHLELCGMAQNMGCNLLLAQYLGHFW